MLARSDHIGLCIIFVLQQKHLSFLRCEFQVTAEKPIVYIFLLRIDDTGATWLINIVSMKFVSRMEPWKRAWKWPIHIGIE